MKSEINFWQRLVSGSDIVPHQWTLGLSTPHAKSTTKKSLTGFLDYYSTTAGSYGKSYVHRFMSFKFEFNASSVIR